ncbi:MAG: hypothetical protein A3J81_00590 [Nitrospirae bacterium RIFOXYB2_FULL_43_5]|jgi:L-lactate utilization protein LutB|nr:MAG: hypothetical protein A2X54_06840 [Nitrospirae bacterium GWF2_44_13]OGW63289.1 MAG: hypothetical protein A2222_07470 [Nitrospirae bacterium RIFOXYA2_FULL_44_9]OGW70545.1 MAG: hypothetical protein A2484_09290 [Nitrospirae bacterium RIFOXYC2_FULL_44_7]OGW73156.1 MAG: hypothetical protein A3J81_00590 [Nitrospirae bacterium RIFOXYB2_FULL_43_5]HBG92177.1 hypothetical protein [Nitrospiraceae bacterium]
MPPTDVHIKTSIERTGKEYKEVHEWIDKDEAKKVERHDITKMPQHIKEIELKWGEEGVREYVQHIHDDVKKRIADTLAYFGIK